MSPTPFHRWWRRVKEYHPHVSRFLSGHPATAFLIVLLLVVTPGLSWQTYLWQRQGDTITRLRHEATARKTTQDCLLTYTKHLTDALQDRDAVGQAQRAATIELDNALIRVLANPSQHTVNQARLALLRHRGFVRRLQDTAAANPYPMIQDCLP